MQPAARGSGALAVLIAVALHRVAAGDVAAAPRGGSSQGQEEVRLDVAVVGTVVNGLSGKPVPDVRVAASESPGWGEGVITDAQGRFVLRNLPRGRFVIHASTDSSTGPVTGGGSYGQTTWSTPARTVEVSDGQVLRGLVVPFWPDAVITGRVIDGDGEPLAGAVVDEMTRSAVWGWRGRTNNLGELCTTDERGIYRLTHPPGTLLIAASTIQRRARSVDGDLTRLQSLVFLDTLFPGATNPADAKPVTLQPGEERTHVDFQMIAVASARVSGTVVNGPNPSADVSVQLTPIGTADGPRLPFVPEVVTDRSGRFSFTAVQPGDYRLSAMSGLGCRGADGTEEVAPVHLNVPTVDAAGIRLTMRPCPVLTGEMQFEGARRPGPEEISGMWIGVPDPGVPAVFLMGRGDRLTPAGLFSKRVPAGRRVLFVGPPAGWTVKSITVDGRDATDRPIDLLPGSTNHVVVRLVDRPSSVTGVITPGAVAPSESASVFLFPADETERREATLLLRRVREERVRDGSFTFTDVPAGDYFIAAVHGIEPGDWPAGQTMDRMQSAARRITLAVGESQRLALVVIDASKLPPLRSSPADESRLTTQGLPPAPIDSGLPSATSKRAPVILGHVLVSGSDAPIAGAIVTLERQEVPAPITTFKDPGPDQWEILTIRTGPTVAATTISDESGRYSFVDINAGVYTIRTERPPFADGAFGAGRFPGLPTPLVVRTGEPLHDLDIRMHPGAVITGSVTDSAGAILRRASVELFRVNRTIEGPMINEGPLKMIDADDRGFYRFWGLPAGEYGLMSYATAATDNFVVTTAADLEEPLKGPARVSPTSRSPRARRYGGTLYPAGVNPAGVPTTGLLLMDGDEQTIDLRLPFAQPINPSSTSPVAPERPPRPDIGGRVVFAVGSTAPSDLSSIYVVIKPLHYVELSHAWRGAALDPKGRFHINAPYGGRYQWGVVAPATSSGHWVVTSVMVNGRESLDSGTHTLDDGAMDDVVVTLSDRPASVTGALEGSAGPTSRVPDGTYAVLFPADAASRVPESPRVRAVKPDTDGRFGFEGLVPGSYIVATLSDAPEGAWWDRALLERLALTGTRVTLGIGEHASMRLASSR